ncbi:MULTISPECIES: hypothetical protein [unclassified Crossiella]|uniref:hypothetical protein n=1 Tax=unclassified Crossiella TaxID=2620835 RepID=UPI001FFFF8C9|nr:MULTISPECIES: hypothetical protein [unclassified Crossiella]MCK2245259.1 hypothetical protein [Crossiella sp. S99.2]MCK2258912.1 hypothetical protein [Crossiella sp. S99.1]
MTTSKHPASLWREVSALVLALFGGAVASAIEPVGAPEAAAAWLLSIAAAALIVEALLGFMRLVVADWATRRRATGPIAMLLLSVAIVISAAYPAVSVLAHHSG